MSSYVVASDRTGTVIERFDDEEVAELAADTLSDGQSSYRVVPAEMHRLELRYGEDGRNVEMLDEYQLDQLAMDLRKMMEEHPDYPDIWSDRETEAFETLVNFLTPS